MAWNQPGNNGQDNNPWGNNQKKPNQNNQGSPVDKLLRLFKKNSSNNNFPTLLVLGVIGALAAFWVVSGFYTIREGERGVVTRFGKKLDVLVEPGLNWNPTFIDTVYPVDISTVRELRTSGIMLTSDENVVQVEMNVQYRITEPKQYLFSVVDADDSLSQATDSALRAVIGNSTMDKILAEGRTVVRDDTQEELMKTIAPYAMGLSVIDVNFQAARPPEEVRASFDDAIAAREDEQRFMREAEAYANEIIPRANGQSARLLAEARAYQAKTVMEAEGDVARFEKLLPEYKAAPKITSERMYLEAMENVLSQTNKVVVNSKGGNLMLLPLDKLLGAQTNNMTPASQNTPNRAPEKASTTQTRNNSTSTNEGSSSTILDSISVREKRASNSYNSNIQSR